MASEFNVRGPSKTFTDVKVSIGGRNRQDLAGARTPMGTCARDDSSWAEEQTQIYQHSARLSNSPFQFRPSHGWTRG